MKLLFISPSFYPSTYYGGPIYSSYELAQALKKQGVTVQVVTTNANGKERLNVKTGVWHILGNELLVKYYNSLDSWGTSISMLFNLFKEIKNTDIIYLVSIFSAPTPFTIFICKISKKPIIISPRGQLGKWCVEHGNPFKKLWLRLFIQPFINSTKPAFYWHLTSETEKQSVLEVYPNANTFVIPNGVNEDLFSFKDRPKDKSFYNKYSGFDCSDKKIIISMGRLHKVKGFDILITAIREVHNSILFIAGEDFGERKTLEQLVDKFGLKQRVFLIGKIEGMEKIEFLRNADLFALASHHENFGLVFAESLACGVPIIASENTPWQIVTELNCGRWVNNTSVDFTNALTEVLKSDTKQMGKNGSRYVSNNFNSKNSVKLFLELIKNIKRI